MSVETISKREKLQVKVVPMDDRFCITINGNPAFASRTVAQAEALRWAVHALYEADELIRRAYDGRSCLAIETAITKLDTSCP